MSTGSRSEDLTVIQGTDALFKINIKDSEGAEFDVTDKAFAASLKKSFSSSDSSSIDFTTNISVAQSGIISISLTNAQTLSLDVNSRYVYDVMMYDAASGTEVQSILRGKVFVEPSVTRVS